MKRTMNDFINSINTCVNRSERERVWDPKIISQREGVRPTFYPIFLTFIYLRSSIPTISIRLHHLSTQAYPTKKRSISSRIFIYHAERKEWSLILQIICCQRSSFLLSWSLIFIFVRSDVGKDLVLYQRIYLVKD